MAAPNDDEWRPPYDAEVKYHLPAAGKPWEQVVDSTRHKKAKFGPHPSVTAGQIAAWQMEIVQEALEYQRKTGERSPNEIIPRRNEYEHRGFWRDMGFVVGAYRGEETTFIYVEYGVQGNVHSYPVTRDQLRKWGADV